MASDVTFAKHLAMMLPVLRFLRWGGRILRFFRTVSETLEWLSDYTKLKDLMQDK